MTQEYKSWPQAVLVAIDQLGNAIAGGHPEVTISARVGFFSKNARHGRLYWLALEQIIDLSFYPIDGPGHCYKMWKADIDKLFQRGSDIARIILSLLILVICPIIAVVLLVVVIFKPSWRY